jgi:predicted membrane protein
MEAVIMFAIIALVLLALVALTVLGFAVHVLFWPLLLVAVGILAWTRLRPGRAGR